MPALEVNGLDLAFEQFRLAVERRGRIGRAADEVNNDFLLRVAQHRQHEFNAALERLGLLQALSLRFRNRFSARWHTALPPRDVHHLLDGWPAVARHRFWRSRRMAIQNDALDVELLDGKQAGQIEVIVRVDVRMEEFRGVDDGNLGSVSRTPLHNSKMAKQVAENRVFMFNGLLGIDFFVTLRSLNSCPERRNWSLFETALTSCSFSLAGEAIHSELPANTAPCVIGALLPA